MAFTSNFSSIEIGHTCALYARNQKSVAWRALGTVTRTSRGANLVLRPEAELCRPIWDACANDDQGTCIGRVTFGVRRADGVIDTIACAEITPEVARTIRLLTLGVPRPRQTNTYVPGGPRPLISNYPTWATCDEYSLEAAKRAT